MDKLLGDSFIGLFWGGALGIALFIAAGFLGGQPSGIPLLYTGLLLLQFSCRTVYWTIDVLGVGRVVYCGHSRLLMVRLAAFYDIL